MGAGPVMSHYPEIVTTRISLAGLIKPQSRTLKSAAGLSFYYELEIEWRITS
jgi:hypothetical protein